MWDFPQYKSKEQAFKSLSQGSLEVVEARAFRTVLKIRYKFSLVHL